MIIRALFIVESRCSNYKYFSVQISNASFLAIKGVTKKTKGGKHNGSSFHFCPIKQLLLWLLESLLMRIPLFLTSSLKYVQLLTTSRTELSLIRNFSNFSTFTEVFVALNIASSITATLGNALILIALQKESTLNPPSKLFLRCMAFSDLSVGLLAQPAIVISFLFAVYQRWDLCLISEYISFFLTQPLLDFRVQQSPLLVWTDILLYC